MAKAEAAQQKAEIAKDASAYERAWREAGRLWERAAEREPDAKRRTLYSANADRARAAADAPQELPDVPADTAPDEQADGTPDVN